jgi:hypothetical protein
MSMAMEEQKNVEFMQTTVSLMAPWITVHSDQWQFSVFGGPRILM